MEHSNVTASKIKEVFSDAATAKFEWAIPNYLNLPKRSCKSPTVKYFNVNWQLEIDRNSNSVYVSRRSGFQESFRCTIGCKKADGSELVIVRDVLFRENNDMVWLYTDFTHLTSSGELTLTCTLWKDDDSPYEEVVSRIMKRELTPFSGGRIDEHTLKGITRATKTEEASCINSQINECPSKGITRATQTEEASCIDSRINECPSKDISVLLEHLKELQLSGDHHDFLMKVKDKEFRAHKCVLQARSPVFAAMFRSQMAESADNSVTIDDCDPDAFGEFLSYVYTGKVDISSVSHALGLYHAGDKYDFPRLKEMSVEFLTNSLTSTRISDVINLAVTHDEGDLLQRALVYLATHLEEVMVTVQWQRFLITNPIQANEMCIKALRCVKKA